MAHAILCNCGVSPLIRLISAKELAERLGISIRTLEDLIVRGEIPSPMRFGRARRWEPELVERWIKKKAEDAAGVKHR